jgi:hypothetical protein
MTASAAIQDFSHPFAKSSIIDWNRSSLMLSEMLCATELSNRSILPGMSKVMGAAPAAVSSEKTIGLICVEPNNPMARATSAAATASSPTF